MEREGIVRLILENAATVLSIDVAALAPYARLEDAGANSMDRMEIVTMTMEALDVDFPLLELGGVDSIEELAGVFERKTASARR